MKNRLSKKKLFLILMSCLGFFDTTNAGATIATTYKESKLQSSGVVVGTSITADITHNISTVWQSANNYWEWQGNVEEVEKTVNRNDRLRFTGAKATHLVRPDGVGHTDDLQPNIRFVPFSFYAEAGVGELTAGARKLNFSNDISKHVPLHFDIVGTAGAVVVTAGGADFSKYVFIAQSLHRKLKPKMCEASFSPGSGYSGLNTPSGIGLFNVDEDSLLSAFALGIFDLIPADLLAVAILTGTPDSPGDIILEFNLSNFEVANTVDMMASIVDQAFPVSHLSDLDAGNTFILLSTNGGFVVGSLRCEEIILPTTVPLLPKFALVVLGVGLIISALLSYKSPPSGTTC